MTIKILKRLMSVVKTNPSETENGVATRQWLYDLTKTHRKIIKILHNQKGLNSYKD